MYAEKSIAHYFQIETLFAHNLLAIDYEGKLILINQLIRIQI